MGVLYTVMIREVVEAFKRSGELNLEQYLKRREEELKAEYRLYGILFYSNLDQVLSEQGVYSEYFSEKLRVEREIEARESFFENEELERLIETIKLKGGGNV